MSELKTYFLGKNNGREFPVYLKSEADKVIAELEEKLDIYKRGWMENDRVNANQYAEIRHHKYKRCLAMARWCNERHTFNETNEKRTWLHKWHNRWLELADKFKPNSTAQQGKGKQMKSMIETKHDLLTTKYTKVLEEKDYKYNAPHTFVVCKADDGHELERIHFQEGPIKECGVNGVCNEDLIVMVIRRLEGFQNSEFKCRENACAITKLEEALLWLRKRTMGRENRGVEGTNKV